MSERYSTPALSDEDCRKLQRVHDDLLGLSACPVPSVNAAARAALAHVVQAMSGQGLAYELYTASLPAEE